MCAAPYPDCTGAPDMGLLTVTGVVVDYPGFRLRDGTGRRRPRRHAVRPDQPGPTGFVEATATATLKILSVVVDTFGAGYTSRADRRRSATPAPAPAPLRRPRPTSARSSRSTYLTGGSGYITPGGIKKFVDTLPGLTEAGANNLGQYIPVAEPDTTTFPGTDYYVIARRPAPRADELEPARHGHAAPRVRPARRRQRRARQAGRRS